MPAPTLAIQDVKTVFKRYDDQGKPRPGLLKTLDEVGQLKGVDGKVGSIPRLKKLIDEINLEEINQRFDLKKPLPDPITALASQLYNQLYEDFETYEARIRNEYTDDFAALTQQIETLHETIDNQQQTLDELQQTVIDTQTQLTDARQTIAQQSQQLIKAETALTQKDSLLEKSSETLAATKSLLMARENDFATQLNHNNEKITALDAQLLKISIDHAKALKEKDRHIDDLKTDVIGRQAYIQSLDEKVRQFEKAAATYSTTLQDKDKTVVEKQNIITTLNEQQQHDQKLMMNLQEQLTKRSEEILQLNRQLFEKEKTQQTLSAEIETLKKDQDKKKVTDH